MTKYPLLKNVKLLSYQCPLNFLNVQCENESAASLHKNATLKAIHVEIMVICYLILPAIDRYNRYA